MKIIILLREPVARTFSQYSYKKISLSFINWINLSKDSKKIGHFKKAALRHTHHYAILKSSYYYQLKYLLSYFPRNQVYIGIFEKIIKNPHHEYNAILRFLNLKQLKRKTCILGKEEIHKTSYKRKITDHEFKYVYSLIKKDKDNLYKLLGYKINEWEDVYMKKKLN